MASFVRRTGLVLRDHRLPGVRARFALFVVVLAVAAVPAVLLSRTPGEYKLLALIGVLWLVLARLRELRRARLGLWPLDLVDAGVFALLGMVPDSGSVVGMLFTCVMFRALFGSTPRVWLSVVLYSFSFAIVSVVAPFAAPLAVQEAAVYALAAPMIGYLMSSLRDSITAHEEALRVEHTAVVDNEQFLAAVLDNLSDGVMACDPDGTLTVVNRAAIRFQGSEAVPGSLGVADAPLRRALAGERVTDAELSVNVGGGKRRVVLANGQPIGTPGAREQGRPGAVVTLTDITERRLAEQALRHQAMHDALTGLPNRTLLLDRIVHALSRQVRHPSPLCLVFIDLDHFKQVNDMFGHAAGDRLLSIISDRIQGELRPDDTPCRLGGDEFAILLEDTTRSEAMRIAERIRSALAEPALLEGRSWTIRASLGVAEAEHGADADMLLRCADLAMYAAKQDGRDRVRVFSRSMYDAARDEAELEAQLQVALERGELFLAFQPVVKAVTGRIVGAEALLRWQHPDRGVVMPTEFVAAAERSGLMEPIGRWAIGEASRQAAVLQSGLADGEFLMVSVNLSPRQLADPALVPTVREALAAAGVSPATFALEVTESALSTESATVIASLEQLRDLGVMLALDDFGTGYSSLARLHEFPFRVVKIDRSFVAELEHGRSAVIDTVLSLARDLDLITVAEGVETPRQLEELLARGCENIQGFLFSEAVSVAEFQALLERSPRRVAADAQAC